MLQAYLLFTILIITLGLFIWGRLRYDIVAFSALLVAVLSGVVPVRHAFNGFANPAVVTVACVMIMTNTLTHSGFVQYAVHQLNKVTKHTMWHVALLTAAVTFLSAFMNNVGALALIMPIALQSARKSRRSPSLLLMPIAFGSILGGLTTEIGTPANIIISSYREFVTGHAYAMFDFTPVGAGLAVIGVIFISIIGWRLLPLRRPAPEDAEDIYHVQDYITEIRVPEHSSLVGASIDEFEAFTNGDVATLGLIRGGQKKLIVPLKELIQKDDILMIEAAHDDLQKLLNTRKVELVSDKKISSEVLYSDKVRLMEAVVPQGSRSEGRSAIDLRLRSRYRINLVAIAREGKPFKQRLNHVDLRAGDVVLLQGEDEYLAETITVIGLLPLVERPRQVVKRSTTIISLGIFIAAVIVAALQLVPIQVAFASAVIAMLLCKVMPARRVYESVDWSIIILLAAIIPLGDALQITGGTLLIAKAFQHLALYISPVMILGLLLIITMTLSDVLNNVATAVVMAPIAVSIAHALHVNIDPFLMTVAIGSSCAFITPIGHQNNTLVMGPGGYKFIDYIRLGLPLQVIVLFIGLPLILWVWPL